ncbi:11257_t:CDS:1, partial [Funneliformis geosporum]
SKEILKVLESHTFKEQKYLFTYEKRTRGWRLKEMEEIKEELAGYSFPPPEELIRIRKKLSDPKYD